MKKLFTIAAFLLICCTAFSQVGIGNTDPKAQLDITAGTPASEKDGLLIPRLAEFPSGVSADQDGMLVFITGAGAPARGFHFYTNGSGWTFLGASGGNTLDQSYDQGGAGAGRIITADNGAVQINGTGTETLEINNTANQANGVKSILTSTSSGNNDRAAFSGQIAPYGLSTKTGFYQGSSQDVYGLRVDATIDNSYDNFHGVHNRISGTTSLNNVFGVYNFMSVDVTAPFVVYGVQNRILGAGTGSKYGSYTLFGNSTAGTLYGSYNYLGTTSDGSAKYGTYNSIPAAAGGTHYGTYNDVQKTTGYAGYFVGRASFGNSTSNRYILPATDGTSGQVITTDGSGQLSFTTETGDADWFEEGTTTAPNAITDDIYTQGNVAIGKNTADYPLDIELTGTAANPILTKMVDNSTGTGDHVGIQQTMGGSHDEIIKGVETFITNSGTGLHTAIAASVTNGSGNQTGVRATINGASGSNTIYSGNIFNSGTGSTAAQTGLNVGVAQPSSQISYGLFSTLNATGVNATGIKYGFYNLIDGGVGTHYGVYNDVRGTENNTKYGTYNLFGIGTTNTGGILYGSYNAFGSSITSTTDKYGSYTQIPATLAGTHYGVYSDVRNATGFAGYFLGKTYVSTKLGVGTGATNPTGFLEVRANNSGSQPNLNLVDIGGSGARINFSNTGTTNGNTWTFFGDTDNTTAVSRFNLFHTTTGNVLQVTGDGKLGILRAPATNRLEVNGNASKSAAGDWLANSDRRLKKNIETIDSKSALDRITSLRGVTYEWNDDKTGTNRPEGIQYGFIAQELMEVFPEHVTKDNLGFYQTAYGTYDALYVQALKEQQFQIEKLQTENEKLKDKISKFESLETRLSALENGNTSPLEETITVEKK